MKYRLVQRKGRWAVQEWLTSFGGLTKAQWVNVAIWRFRFIAALHLLILRERSRR